MARIATARRSRAITTSLGIALVVLLAGTVSPALGGPTATGAGAGALATAKRALGLAKRADSRSKLALRRAGVPGPVGPAGSPGARGSEGFDGSDGARGPKGATGQQGAVGPAGPTASKSVTTNTAVDISTSATVLDLSAAPIVVPFAGRLMATATVQLHNPSADPREARCKLQILDTLDPAAVASDMSQTYVADLPGVAEFDATVTISGATTKPSGTYDISLVCSESSAASLSAERAHLQVWAAD